MHHIKNYIRSIDLNIFLVFSLLFITYSIILRQFGHDFDTYSWKEWSKFIYQNGLANTYKSWTDYLPLYHYILYIFGQIQGSLEHIEQNIHSLKIFTLIFDFISGYLIYFLLRKKYTDSYKALILSLFYFLNIAYFYNTLIWGQVDGIMACFVLLSLYMAIKEKVLFSLIFLILSLNVKLQSIIFIPIIGLILIPSLVSKFSFKNMSLWLGGPIFIQFIILLPFIITGDLGRIWIIVYESVDKYPVISMNAYNFWLFFFPKDFMTTSDTLKFMGLTLKSWGLILFFTMSLIALFPLLKNLLNKILKKESTMLSQYKIFIIAALIALIFFFFNTQMHERYSHPAILFLAIYALLYNRYLPYIVGSIAYFLNMEDVLKYLNLHNYSTLFFTNWVISIIYLITISILFYDLFKKESQIQENYF